MSQLDFMMITASPAVAAFIEQHGVARIFLDQEVLGKAARQGHLDTHKAAHTLEEIAAVASVLTRAELMVRLNPLHAGSSEEIMAALDHGAQRLMLPMFTSRHEVEQFLDCVAGRAPVTFLAETPQALVRLAAWLPLLEPGHDEVHFGLNDLSLGMGLKFLFEPMAGRLLDPAARQLDRARIRWGIGGVSRIGHGDLPAEILLGEHVRLGSSWVILSRAFHQGASSSADLMGNLQFPEELMKLRDAEKRWRNAHVSEVEANHEHLARLVFAVTR